MRKDKRKKRVWELWILCIILYQHFYSFSVFFSGCRWQYHQISLTGWGMRLHLKLFTRYQKYTGGLRYGMVQSPDWSSHSTLNQSLSAVRVQPSTQPRLPSTDNWLYCASPPQPSLRPADFSLTQSTPSTSPTSSWTSWWGWWWAVWRSVMSARWGQCQWWAAEQDWESSRHTPVYPPPSRLNTLLVAHHTLQPALQLQQQHTAWTSDQENTAPLPIHSIGGKGLRSRTNTVKNLHEHTGNWTQVCWTFASHCGMPWSNLTGLTVRQITTQLVFLHPYTYLSHPPVLLNILLPQDKGKTLHV